MRELGLHQICPTPGTSSDSQGQAETSVQVLKNALRRVVYTDMSNNDRKRWDHYLVFIAKLINGQKMRGLPLSRAGLFFSQYHNLDFGTSPIDISFTPAQASELQYRSLKSLMKLRLTVLGRLHKKYPDRMTFHKGQIVALVRSDADSKTKEDGTRALSLPSAKILKIIDIFPEGKQAVCLCLHGGGTKTYHVKELRALEATDLAALQMGSPNFLADLRNSRESNIWRRLSKLENGGLQWKEITSNNHLDFRNLISIG